MGEIRLICPKCGAEYRVPDAAIPPTGREVECSSCGHMWFQQGSQPAQPAETPQPEPKLSRPLPDSVLSVLREEAELARQQRSDAETTASAPVEPSPPQQAQQALKTDLPDWPATTVTAPDAALPSPGPVLPSDMSQMGPAPSRHINTQPARPTETAPALQELEATVNRTTPHTSSPGAVSEPTITPPVEAAKPAQDPAAYRRGFTWALGIAAVFLLLYAVSPRFEALTGFRTTMDDGRIWLSERAHAIFTGE